MWFSIIFDRRTFWLSALRGGGRGDRDGTGLLHRVFNERPVVGQSQKQAPADVEKKLAAKPGGVGAGRRDFVQRVCGTAVHAAGFLPVCLNRRGLGTKMFATHQICMNICNICFSCYDGFAAAAAALVGQNLGRRRSDRAECVTVICNRLAMTMAVLMVAGLILFRAPLIQMFTADPEIIRLGSWIMILFALSVPS